MRARLLMACALWGCTQAQAPSTTTASTPDASVAAPPAEPMKQLRHALSHSAQNVRVERRSGRLHMDMGGTFQTASVVTVDAQGQPQRQCLDNSGDLDRMMRSAP